MSEAEKKKRRRSEPPPSIVTDEMLRVIGGNADQIARNLAQAGAPGKQHYGYNQMAHWLWRLAGAEPSDLVPEDADKIRAPTKTKKRRKESHHG